MKPNFCNNPITMYYTVSSTPENPSVTIHRAQSHGIPAYPVSCRKCWKCRRAQSREWAVRILHEATLQPHNQFITLTYAPKYLPANGTLVKKDFQLFMKRLRLYNPTLGVKHISDDGKISYKIRYYHAGEYGDNFDRPHYHAILFGVNLPDLTYFKTSKLGFRLYRSAILEKAWTLGYSTVGKVTLKSASYVAQYCTKKIIGNKAETHYGSKIPEYATMSRSPAIGEKYYLEHADQIHTEGSIPYMKHRIKIPAHYKLLRKRNQLA